MNTFSPEIADGVYRFSRCHATALSGMTAPTIRRLAGLEPRTPTRSAYSKRGSSPCMG
jgi:hypothetical protein